MVLVSREIFMDLWVSRCASFDSDRLALLGRWVSELEPEVVCYLPGAVEGVRAKGFRELTLTRRHLAR